MTRIRCALSIILLLLCPGCGHKTQVQAPKASRTAQAPVPPPPASTPQVEIPPVTTPSDLPPPAPLPAPEMSPGNPGSGPAIRIGLSTGARQIRISSPDALFVLEKVPEASRRRIKGPVEIRVENAVGELTRVFRVQVASLSRQGAAEELRRKLSDELDMPGVVREASADRFQVRVGQFASRAEAQRFAEGPLHQAGYGDAFVVQDSAPAANGAKALVLRGPDRLLQVSAAGFLFYPPGGDDLLSLDGRPYRGFLDISLNKGGLITVVNQVGVEEYLFGVVPAEMSPSTYPAPAALAAQAIAARTYALKNMGRFRAEGFDLTNDTRTQVYGGAAAERVLSSEAVRSTAGLAVYYQGRLIDAMYTSTCGGRTEDFAAVYDTNPVPYLTSVLCAVESEEAGGGKAGLRGSHLLDRLVFSGDGRIVNRELELAPLLGFASGAGFTPDYMEQPAQEAEIRDWVDAVRRAAGRNTTLLTADGPDLHSNAGLVRYVAESLFGAREIERSISGPDAAYYLGNLKDGGAVPAAARIPIAFMIQKGLWLAFPDNSVRAPEAVKRKDALALLVRTFLYLRPETLNAGVLEDMIAPESGGGEVTAISVKWGNRTRRIPVAPDVRLFQRGAERSTPSERLLLIGNEKLVFHLDASGRVDLLEAGLNPTGAASDRFSPLATWQLILTRAQISEKLKPLAPGVGELRDLEPERIGKSGRVVRLRVVGSQRAVVINGYQARNALGLRDTLFTISRTPGPDGIIDKFTFDGRGWGHGVGLCQVGAYGMARAGRSYEEILKTYYVGVEIGRAY